MTGTTLTDEEILAVLPICECVALKFRQIPTIEDRLDEAAQGLVQAIESYSAEKAASFKTYAPVVVRNHLLNAIREGKVRESPDVLIALHRTRENETAHEVLVAREDSERLHAALEQLMPDVRMALEMRFGLGEYEEATLKQIGAALGMSKTYAVAAVAAGLVRLAKLMEE
jgi:RNA polymerase sigma factor (sigma-70 family)